MYRLVATDLDGTVVRWDGTVTARTRRALASVEEAGLRLVLVTGRPPRWLDGVAEALGHRGLAICANGAFVYDLHVESVVEQFLLDPQPALAVVERIRAVLPDATFAVETDQGFARDPSFRQRWDPDVTVPVAPVEELVAQPVAKLLVRVETSHADAMLAAVGPLLQGLGDATHSNAADCLLEVSAAGVSKATTLELLAARWGITSADVVAFGDMPNDVPMLRWAGHGVAVASAHAGVLDVVDEVAPSVDHDGVAQVLERLLAAERPADTGSRNFDRAE